eukprot:984387-Rhodomonas_salina.4
MHVGIVLRIYYAVFGTETRALLPGADNWGDWCGGATGISLRAFYVLSGTDILHALLSAYALSGTDKVLSAPHALGTQLTHPCCAPDNSTCLPVGRATCVEASGWVCVGGENNGLACRGKGDCEWRGGKCEPLAFHEQFGVRLRCGAGEYDELGTLLFGAKEGSIARMVTQAHPHEPFSNTSLFLAALAHLALMIMTYGTSLPCGFFMPCWLIGYRTPDPAAQTPRPTTLDPR